MSNPWFDPTTTGVYVSAAPLPTAVADADAVRLAARQVRPHFQPIVDLLGGTVLGSEVLSRAPRFPNILDAFTLARAQGLGWELEAACRSAALAEIAALNGRARGLRFFLNVGPEVLSDPRFVAAFTGAALRRQGIDPAHLVLELTEQRAVSDHGRFGELIEHYANEGFEIAIDDFGVGHSSLITLVSCSPHFLKLDSELVRNIQSDSYRQRLVRSLVGFAQSLDSKLVAEGVETFAELEVLVRLGVRFAQGFLFAEPERNLHTLPPERRAEVRHLMEREGAWRGELSESINALVISAPTAEPQTLTCGELEQLYRQKPTLDELVVLDAERRPVGLVTRQHFFDRANGPAAAEVSALFIDEVAKANFLMVEAATPVTSLSRLAMERGRQELYDPILVVSAEGKYVGAVTVRQLLVRSAELEIQSAEGENPLTRLPGNRAILCWLTGVLSRKDFTIVYADLDRLKEFNDVYGFVAGDELIRVAAKVLSAGATELGEHARLGHLGGDDFVLVCAGPCSNGVLDWICAEFDREKRHVFRRDDLASGQFLAKDRRGDEVAVPLTTLSLAAIDAHKISPDVHPALFFQIAASLKKKAKQETSAQRRSLVLFERRRYPETPPPRS
jgi:EAL domain-containing protein (putative c-di-GMP-specific phosphodiesterase class I)/GGDEF domain-containing protein